MRLSTLDMEAPDLDPNALFIDDNGVKLNRALYKGRQDYFLRKHIDILYVYNTVHTYSTL